ASSRTCRPATRSPPTRTGTPSAAPPPSAPPARAAPADTASWSPSLSSQLPPLKDRSLHNTRGGSQAPRREESPAVNGTDEGHSSSSRSSGSISSAPHRSQYNPSPSASSAKSE